MILCIPAIIYLIFSITQILIDTFKGLYNTALMKFLVMTIVTILLNFLCEAGLNVVSWIIVFIPFILMTVTVTLLLYFFGLNATTGTTDYTCKNYPENISVDSSGNIIIYDPNYNYIKNPAYYNSPNIFVPNPQNAVSTPVNSNTNTNIVTNSPITPYWKPSRGAYQS
jgi:hypothetical protein